MMVMIINNDNNIIVVVNKPYNSHILEWILIKLNSLVHDGDDISTVVSQYSVSIL